MLAEKTQSGQEYLTLFEHAAEPMWVVNDQGCFIDVNRAAREAYGYSADQFRQLHIMDISAAESPEMLFSKIQEIDRQGTFTFETRHRMANGEFFDAEVKASVFFNKSTYILAICRDITERKQIERENRFNQQRLESLVRIFQEKSNDVQKLLDHALQEAISLTESRLGYIYHYDDKKQEFILNTWSKEVMQECMILNPSTTYELGKTGIWGEVVRQRKPIMINDFQAPHPLKKGYPEGHAPLHRFLSLPVIENDDKIVAVVGVANAAREYTQTDKIGRASCRVTV